MALSIFPYINSKYDPYFKTGINIAWVILNYFLAKLLRVLKTFLFNGVDINREEKI